jgi:hypothetical protein
MTDKIPLPAEIYKVKERASDKKRIRQLIQHDETRLFYVAASRAKANLIFTASPAEGEISSFYLHEMNIAAVKPAGGSEKELLLESLNQVRECSAADIQAVDVIRGLITEIVLTPTKVNNYLSCNRKFFYDTVLKLPGKKKPGLVFGNCCHKALEETYRKFIAEDKFPNFAFFTAAFKRELEFQGVDRSIEKGCLDKLDALKLWFETNSRNPVRPIGLEKSISITIGNGIHFVGKYDKVEIENEKEKRVQVIDYKTGKPDKHIKTILNFSGDLRGEDCDYIRQLVAYKMLFERERPGQEQYRVSCGILTFLEPVQEDAPKYNLKKGEFVNEKFQISDQMVSELEEIIKDAWKNIQGLNFEKLPKRDVIKCRNCDFDAICWG